MYRAKNNSIAYCKLPRAGLANMLLTWAEALVFSKNHSIPIISKGWYKIKIGPLIRRERSKRFYWNYFKYDIIRSFFGSGLNPLIML